MIPTRPRPFRLALEASALLPPRTGIGRYAAALVRQFARDPEIELTLLINAWLPKYAAAVREVRREFAGPRVHWRIRWLPGRLTRKLDGWHGGWRMSPRPDLVHGPNFLLPRVAGAPPGIITINDLYFLENMEEEVVHNYRSELPDSVKRARAVVAISETTAAAIRRYFPTSGEKLAVIPLGVAEEFLRAPAGPPPPLPARFVLSVGSTGKRKNLPALASALAGSGLGWLVAGPAGDDEAPLRAACARAGVALERRAWLSDSELNHAYRHAAALVAPSRQEGHFFPAYEATAAGCPVVASDLPVFRDGAARHGWTLVPVGNGAGDEPAWRAALAAVETLPKPRASGLVTETECAARHLALYRKIAAG